MTNGQNQIQLTQEGYDEIVAELSELKVKEQAGIDRVALARQHGDLSENAEYHAAKDDLTFITSRIEELENVLAQAKVIKHGKASSTIKIGSTVVLRRNSQTVTYNLVTAWEADPMENKISVESPLGKALMGKKQGDKFNVDVPAGQQSYEILEVK